MAIRVWRLLIGECHPLRAAVMRSRSLLSRTAKSSAAEEKNLGICSVTQALFTYCHKLEVKYWKKIKTVFFF